MQRPRIPSNLGGGDSSADEAVRAAVDATARRYRQRIDDLTRQVDVMRDTIAMLRRTGRQDAPATPTDVTDAIAAGTADGPAAGTCEVYVVQRGDDGAIIRIRRFTEPSARTTDDTQAATGERSGETVGTTRQHT